MNEIADRIVAGAAAIAGHGPRIEAGEPWPLSRAYGTEPESDWGPKEVLAHVAEMIPYWLAQIEKVAGGEEPVPFGRVVSDPDRIERIGRDRLLPTRDLLERITRSAADAAARLRGLDAVAAGRIGIHPRLGELPVAAIAERFIADHLADHDAQLATILETRANRNRSDARG